MKKILFILALMAGIASAQVQTLNDLKHQLDHLYKCKLTKIIKNYKDVYDYDGKETINYFGVKGSYFYVIVDRIIDGQKDYGAFPVARYLGRKDDLKVYGGVKYGNVYIKIDKGWISDEIIIVYPVSYTDYFSFECEDLK